jgi:predicted transcriptional regulator of viral defense system
MKDIKQLFRRQHGYARMKDLKQMGFHPRVIASAVVDGEIEKVKRGLYKLTNYTWDENSSFLDVNRANRRAVICLLSALSYHELTTFNPSEIMVAVPHNTTRFRIVYPPVRVFYYPDRFYSIGINQIKTKNGSFRIYNKEKTICDMFRYRKQLGEDVAIEALKNYVRSKSADLKRLHEYAVLCQVKSILIPYLRALVG